MKIKLPFKQLVKNLLLLAAIFCLALSSDTAMQAAKDALSTCLYILLPSLFPFFVLSRMLVKSGGAALLGRACDRIMRPLFNINGNGAAAFILGIISGYPVGAKTVTELYREKALSKPEAENLLCFSNNSGPLFILGAVGTGMLANRQAGIVLYIIHVLASVSVGVLLRFTIPSSGIRTLAAQRHSSEDIFTSSVEDSVTTLLHVFGYVIFFAVVMQLLQDFHCIAFFTQILSSVNLPGEVTQALTCGALELTTGIKKLSGATAVPLSIKLVFISAVLGWAGLSVHFQVKGILSGSGLSFGKYLMGKGLHAVIAAVYAAVAMYFIKLDTPVFAPAIVTQTQSCKLPLFFAIASLIILLLYTNRVMGLAGKPKRPAQRHRPTTKGKPAQ